MITSDDSTIGDITTGSSGCIDFALWVLLQDGLQVPPFDRHTGGNQILQSLGMTQANWYSWFKRILIRHDSRLLRQALDIDAEIEKYIKAEKEAFDGGREHDPDNIICDQLWCERKSETYRAMLNRQQEVYIEALADYPGMNLKFIQENKAPQLWQDSLEIQGMLNQLWSDYEPLKYSNEFIKSVLITPRMWDIEEKPPTLKHREMYLVDYPFEAEIFIPPIFAIVTIPNRPVNQAHLEQRMFNILQNS
ncbi:MAG: hypothetical protein FWK04_29695 [Nostoc sp. GBBB01]|nr:hypothetical protein [Nostoc sp. GBBB01]